MIKTLAIIQARMGSTRLPGKILQPVGGKAAVVRVAEAVAPHATWVIVALPWADRRHTALRAALDQADLLTEWGAEFDVLDRLAGAASRFPLQPGDRVMRLTADCPLLPAEAIQAALQAYDTDDGGGPWDYAGTTRPVDTYPDGCDVEVFPAPLLQILHEKERSTLAREHVTWPVWNNSGTAFRCAPLAPPAGVDPLLIQHAKWSVDTAEDLQRVQQMADRLPDPGKPVGTVRQLVDAASAAGVLVGG